MYNDVALNMTIVHLNPCCPALLYVNGVHSFLAVFIFVQSLSSAPALMQLTKLAASLSAILMFFFPLDRFAHPRSVNSSDPVHEQKRNADYISPALLGRVPVQLLQRLLRF